MKQIRLLAGAVALTAVVLANPAAAADRLKMTVGQRGNWDTAVLHLGEKAGIFKKHDQDADRRVDPDSAAQEVIVTEDR